MDPHWILNRPTDEIDGKYPGDPAGRSADHVRRYGNHSLGIRCIPRQGFSVANREDRFQAVVALDCEAGPMWINQDAWFSLGNFDAGRRERDRLHSGGNGVDVFVIEGQAEVAGKRLRRRDGLGITEAGEIEFATPTDCLWVAIEVPLQTRRRLLAGCVEREIAERKPGLLS